MNRAVGTLSFCRQLSSCGRVSGLGRGLGLRFLLPKWKKQRWSELGRRRFGLFVSAELSSSLSVDIGLDSQVNFSLSLSDFVSVCRVFELSFLVLNLLIGSEF